MKIMMTQREWETEMRWQPREDDVTHFRDLNGRKFLIIDRKRWAQEIDIEIVDEPLFVDSVVEVNV